MKFLVIIFILLTSVFSSAQKAIIRGKVTDKNSGEELIGATIFLQGTSIGNITDFDGNYSIETTPGTYDIQCSFISYETVNLKSVVLKNNEIKILDFQLGEAVIGLKEVQVEGKQIRKTENALITMQKKSPTVINGISAQEISRTGDSDAAGALKRVTGISVEGGKYIYVRGLSDRYSKTTLNGAEIPGLDPNRNAVQMDLFPSNIIENMIVYKTFSPDLPGSFTGGYVNILTRDFPETFTFLFSTSLGYNSQSSFNKDFLTYEGGKYDWLGFDDGGRKWPISHTNQIPYLYENNDRLDEITESFNSNLDLERKMSLLNHSHSISVGNQFKAGKNSMGYIAALSYQRNFNYYNDGITGRYELTGANEDQLNTDRLLDSEGSSMEVLIGAMFNLSYKISANHKISLTGIRNQGGEKSAKYAYGIKPSDEIGMSLETRNLEFSERSINSGQLKGEHYFENFKQMKVEWMSSFTFSSQNQPDLRYFINSVYYLDNDTIYKIEKSKYNLPSRYSREMSETNFDNKIDFTIPYRYLGAKSKLKFGGAYLNKYRVFAESRIDINSQNNSYNGNIQDYFDVSNIGQNAEGTYGVYLVNSTDIKNSYFGYETQIAGYLMTDIPLNQKLRIVTGGRVETTDIFVESKDIKKKPGELFNVDFLPAVNINYEVIKDLNLRTAYSRTLARPNFRELAPFASYDYETGETRIGNPDLKRTRVDNFDIRIEKYFKSGEVVSLSGFYKRFINPIERTFNPIAANPELTWQNVEMAQLLGTEFEIKKDLGFISVLKNFKAGLNFTYVFSEASMDSLELVSIRATNPDHPDTRVMFGQAPYIINSSLSYANDSLGLNVNVSYNTEGEKLAVVIVSGTPNVYEQPQHSLNANISKKFGSDISLKFSVNNILNAKTKRTYFYNNVEYMYERYSVGRTFSISFTYQID